MEKANLVLGIIGAVVSVFAAIKSIKGSKSAKEYLEEINTKKTAIELGRLKKSLNNLHGEVYKFMLAKETSRVTDREKQKYQEWLNIITNILLQSPKECKEVISGLEEVRDILNSHVYENKSLHNTQKGKESSFQYIEGVLYKTVQLINNKVESY
ncbi:MAG: hypothetical protein FH751_07495 [Firmicutes bacterium]|nr:hypothetical protein [Bacillota bacterium]